MLCRPGSLVATTSSRAAASSGARLKILGISCSARPGMTTARAVQTALDAAKGLDARVTVELIDLGGALGILGSIALIGALTAAAGRMLGDLGPWGNYAVAAVFLVFGLHLLDLLPIPEGWRLAPNQPRRGALGALFFGLIFGVALGPCTFGFMAPVLGVTFGLAKTAPLFAFGVLALFGLGHCAVIGLAGVSSTWVQRWLHWQNETAGAKWLRRGCGVLVLAAGGWLITGTLR